MKFEIEWQQFRKWLSAIESFIIHLSHRSKCVSVEDSLYIYAIRKTKTKARRYFSFDEDFLELSLAVLIGPELNQLCLKLRTILEQTEWWWRDRVQVDFMPVALRVKNQTESIIKWLLSTFWGACSKYSTINRMNSMVYSRYCTWECSPLKCMVQTLFNFISTTHSFQHQVNRFIFNTLNSYKTPPTVKSSQFYSANFVHRLSTKITKVESTDFGKLHVNKIYTQKS